MPAYKNILIIRLSAMGDVAMTVPVIASFVKKYPDVRVTILSNPRFEGMFTGIENVCFTGADTKKRHKGLKGIFTLFKDLTSNGKFDAVFDLHDVLRSKVLRTLFRLKHVPIFVVQKRRREKKELTRSKNKKIVQLKSSIESYREVFEKAGFNFPIDFSGLFGKDAGLPENIRRVLAAKEGKWLAIAPFAKHPGKIYPLEKMKTVVEYFTKKEGFRILLFGGGDSETKILEEWQENFPNVISLSGKFQLTEELQILNQSDALISMDSANMHLASLVKTPVISVWGATHPFAGFYGFNQSADNIIQTDLPCRPCSVYGNKACRRKDYACMNMIQPEEIIRRTEYFWNY